MEPGSLPGRRDRCCRGWRNNVPRLCSLPWDPQRLRRHLCAGAFCVCSDLHRHAAAEVGEPAPQALLQMVKGQLAGAVAGKDRKIP